MRGGRQSILADIDSQYRNNKPLTQDRVRKTSLNTVESFQQSDVWIFFLVFAAIGVLHTTYKTMIATATTMIFSSDKEAASATLCIWDPLGSAIIYMFTSIICNKSFIIMLMVFVTSGTALELIVERRHKTKTDNESGEKPINA